jgi:hypothetical protein
LDYSKEETFTEQVGCNCALRMIVITIDKGSEGSHAETGSGHQLEAGGNIQSGNVSSPMLQLLSETKLVLFYSDHGKC